MKLGVFAVMFGDMPFEQALDYIKSVGVQAVEIGVGGYVGDAHCKPATILNDSRAAAALKEAVASRGLTISALSAHANPLHPDPAIGEVHRAAVTNAILAAEKLGVETVVTFSGCPGGGPEDKHPNWITCPWPPDFSATVKWQWEAVLIPYWRETARFAREHGVRVAIEMHPGFCVYNAETMLALLDAVGSDCLGTNFDPSHLFWQGADPVHVIRALGKSIFHFHAKDTVIDPLNATVNGVLDTKSYTDVPRRSWVFRTVGYGHSEEVWRGMISNLQLVGYEGALSIEHEDGLMSKKEGFEKAVALLKNMLIQEKPGVAYWA
jgi:sugar phosphate isomerase/epimerase